MVNNPTTVMEMLCAAKRPETLGELLEYTLTHLPHQKLYVGIPSYLDMPWQIAVRFNPSDVQAVFVNNTDMRFIFRYLDLAVPQHECIWDLLAFPSKFSLTIAAYWNSVPIVASDQLRSGTMLVLDNKMKIHKLSGFIR